MKNIKTNLSFCPKVYLVTRMKKPKNQFGVIYLVVLLFLSQVLFGQEGTNAKEKPEPRSETGLYIGFGMSKYSMLHRWELGMDNYYENSFVGFTLTLDQFRSLTLLLRGQAPSGVLVSP